MPRQILVLDILSCEASLYHHCLLKLIKHAIFKFTWNLKLSTSIHLIMSALRALYIFLLTSLYFSNLSCLTDFKSPIDTKYMEAFGKLLWPLTTHSLLDLSLSTIFYGTSLPHVLPWDCDIGIGHESQEKCYIKSPDVCITWRIGPDWLVIEYDDQQKNQWNFPFVENDPGFDPFLDWITLYSLNLQQHLV